MVRLCLLLIGAAAMAAADAPSQEAATAAGAAAVESESELHESDGTSLMVLAEGPRVIVKPSKLDPDHLPEEEKFAEEARDDYFAGSSVLLLNRVIFERSVKETSEEEVANWIVFFCVSWWEGCMGLEEPFADLAMNWHEGANKALFKNEVRFAAVDCAVDKVLCNTEGAASYPVVIHYTRKQQAAYWTDRSGLEQMANGLSAFVQERLGHLRVVAGLNSTSLGNISGEWADGCQESQGSVLSRAKAFLAPTVPLDLLVLVAAILGNAYFAFYRSAAGQVRRAKAAVRAEQEAGAASAPKARSISQLLPEDWCQDRKRIEL